MRRKPGELTRQESRCLHAYAKHGSYTEAAAALFITQSTLRNHLQHAYLKLEVDHIPRAGIAAFRKLGWLRVPEGYLHTLACPGPPCDCDALPVTW